MQMRNDDEDIVVVVRSDLSVHREEVWFLLLLELTSSLTLDDGDWPHSTNRLYRIYYTAHINSTYTMQVTQESSSNSIVLYIYLATTMHTDGTITNDCVRITRHFWLRCRFASCVIRYQFLINYQTYLFRIHIHITMYTKLNI